MAEIKSYGAGSKETGAKTSAHGRTSDKSPSLSSLSAKEKITPLLAFGLKCDFSRAGLK